MKWSKAKGGWIEGVSSVAPKTFQEHEKRWKNIILTWEKDEPWRMFFPMDEVVKRFNKNGKMEGFRYMRFVDGKRKLDRHQP